MAAAAVASCSSGSASSGAASAGSTASLQPLTVVLAWYPTAEYGGLYAAQSEGYFRKAGLQVQITPGGPSVDSTTVVAAGRAQVGFAGSDADVLTGAESYPFVEIGTEFETSPEGIEYHSGSPISSFSQLSGKTLYVLPGTPGYQWIATKYHLHNVKQGNFDYSAFIHNTTSFEYGYVTDDLPTLASSGTKAGYLLPATAGFNDHGDVLFTTKSYLGSHQATLKKFIQALQQGWRYYGTHYSSADAVIYGLDKSIPLSVENSIAKAELPFVYAAPATTQGLAYISPADFASLYRTLRSLGVLTKNLPVSQLVDPLASAAIKPPAPGTG